MAIDRSIAPTGTDRTADGVIITDGLRVWTNDLKRGVVDLSNAGYETGDLGTVLWFDVVVNGPSGSMKVMQSNDRVSTVNPFDREPA